MESQTQPIIDPQRVKELIEGLEAQSDLLTQQGRAIDQQLQTVRKAKESLQRLLNLHDPTYAHSGTNDTLPDLQDTWKEYQDTGDIVYLRGPASPAELRQIIYDNPITPSSGRKHARNVAKHRNLMGLKLMAERSSNRTFRLIDFARNMSAVGMTKTAHISYMNALVRHLRSEPQNWKHLGRGQWKYTGRPTATPNAEAPATPKASATAG